LLPDSASGARAPMAEGCVHEASPAAGDGPVAAALPVPAPTWGAAGSAPPGPVPPPRALREEEPLRRLLPHLKPYELAQLSVLAYVLWLFAALQLGVPSLIAVPLLAAIPVGRVCPEAARFLNPWHDRTTSPPRQALPSAVAFLVLSWLAFVCLSSAHGGASAGTRRTPALQRPASQRPPHLPGERASVLGTDCAGLGGLDCSGQLADWAGPGTCVVLAETDGSCGEYCERRSRACERAMKDEGSGACAVDEGGHWRQSAEAGGCRQEWRRQVCACSGRASPEASAQEPPPPPQIRRPEAALSPPAAPQSEEPPAPEASEASAPSEEPPPVPFIEPCFSGDVKYEPLDMPWQGPTPARSAEHCQARCARTAGCAHFTWWSDTWNCHLQEYDAEPEAAAGAVSGPSDCDDEEELEALRWGAAPAPEARHLGAGAAEEEHGDAGPGQASLDIARAWHLGAGAAEGERGGAGHGRASLDVVRVQQRLQLPSEGSPLLVLLVFAAFAAVAASQTLDPPPSS